MLATRTFAMETFRGVMSWWGGGLGRWSASLLSRYLFKASKLWSGLRSICFLLRYCSHFLIGSFSRKFLANRLVIRASSCLMYFSARCINFAYVISDFLLRDPKNSVDVVSFCIASIALNSSKFEILRAFALKRAMYSHKVSSFFCLTVSR